MSCISCICRSRSVMHSVSLICSIANLRSAWQKCPILSDTFFLRCPKHIDPRSTWSCWLLTSWIMQETLYHSQLQRYLEVPAFDQQPLHSQTPDEILLFFKLYDPVQQRLSYLGSLYARKAQKLPNLSPMLNKMASFPEGTPLVVSIDGQDASQQSTCSISLPM